MKLTVKIHNIKCIKDLSIDLPIDNGLYAITGQNGSGKSTIAACASAAFFNIPMKQYFGKTEDDSSISFHSGNSSRIWRKVNGKWQKSFDGPDMNIKGFFEGSLLFGNRFKDMSYDKIYGLESIDQDKLIGADDFIRKNLGTILQGDENYYEKLWMVSNHYGKFKGNIFYYEKDGRRVSQFHMSTGENLLVSILNSLYIRNNDRASLSKPCIMFLDEIELALHPSSLKRLIHFLEDISQQYNYAIYFSTHSIELISGISPSNIFYIERHADNTIEVLNPCYPAYATRILYDHEGYDKVILVEDDLAKAIIDKILREEKLLNNRLVHVLPCGGYANVLNLANDVTTYNLLGKISSISIILDGDVKDQAIDYRQKRNISTSIPLNFLPIESLEKYLRSKLVLNVDHSLFRTLNDYVFQQRSLTNIIEEYKNKEYEEDNDGKKFYNLLDSELRQRRISRSSMIDIVVKHLFEKGCPDIKRLSDFLKKQLS